jgi:hypothetical protein
MRRIILAVAATLVSAVPAEAKWQYYSCESDNFAAVFPDTPKVEKIKFSMDLAKAALSATSYTASVDNIVYKLVVADYSDRVPASASILMEAMANLTEPEYAAVIAAEESGKGSVSPGKVLANDVARDGTYGYGRRITMQLSKNGGRSTTIFFFFGGKLYEQSATVLPANGDYSSPNATRFVESLEKWPWRHPERETPVITSIPGCG